MLVFAGIGDGGTAALNDTHSLKPTGEGVEIGERVEIVE